MTILERLRRRMRRRDVPDLYPVTGYYQAVMPTKKWPLSGELNDREGMGF